MAIGQPTGVAIRRGVRRYVVGRAPERRISSGLPRSGSPSAARCEKGTRGDPSSKRVGEQRAREGRLCRHLSGRGHRLSAYSTRSGRNSGCRASHAAAPRIDSSFFFPCRRVSPRLPAGAPPRAGPAALLRGPAHGGVPGRGGGASPSRGRRDRPALETHGVREPARAGWRASARSPVWNRASVDSRQAGWKGEPEENPK